MSDLVNLSVASGLIDESGALLAEIAEASLVMERWALDEGWSCTIETPIDASWVSAIDRRRVLWLEQEDGSIREYRISALEDGRSGAGDVLRVTAQDPIIDLAERVVWSEALSDGTVLFDGGIAEATASEILTSEIVGQAQAAGIAVDVGTVSAALDAVTLSLTWSGPVTPLALLEQIIQELRARGLTAERDYRRDPGNGYVIDIVTAIGSGVAAPELHVGRHLGPWKRKRLAADQVSRVIPFGGVDATGYRATLGRATWLVSAVNGGADQVTLVDPAGGPGPVQFADQHNDPEGPWYLEAPDGTLVEVTASARTSETDSLLTLADASAFSVNDLVELRADAAGTLLSSIVHPTQIQAPPTGIGPKVVPLDKPDLRGERNEISNPWQAQWADPNDPPDGWTVGTMGVPITSQVTDPLYTQFGAGGWRVNSYYSSAGFFDVYSPPFYPRPRSSTAQYTVSLSLYIFGAATDLRITLGAWYLEIPQADLVTGRRWDVSIAGIPASLVGSALAKVGISRGGATIGGADFVWDAVQVTQTPGAADAFFTGARANALWQAGNRHLADFGDPIPEFEGGILDYARLDPAVWASVAIEPGINVDVVDAERGLSWPIRAIVLERNRLVRGDTRVRWAPRVRAFTAARGSAGMSPFTPTTLPPTAPPAPPGSPTLPPGPTTPVTPVAAHFGVNRYPVFAGAEARSLANFESAETEWAEARQYLFLGGAERIRLTARVVTALAGAKLKAEFYNEATPAWEPLGQTSGGDDGPVISFGSTGDVRSEDVAVNAAAAGDVLVRFLRFGGDDASDVEVGNIMLEAHRGPQLLRPEDAGCGLSGFTVQGDDFAGGVPPAPAYLDTAELLAYAGTRHDYDTAGGGLVGDALLDPAVRFNSRPTLELLVPAAPTSEYVGWWTRLSDNGDPTETPATPVDLWARTRLRIPAEYVLGTKVTTIGPTLQALKAAADFDVNDTAYLTVDGDEFVLTATFTQNSPFSLHTEEAYLGVDLERDVWLDIILRGIITNIVAGVGADYEFRVWAGRACTASLPRLGSITYSHLDSGGADFDVAGFVYVLHNFGNNESNRGRGWRFADWELVPASVDANPFGVTDP